METSINIRKKFLNFFAQQNHTIVPSDNLIPASDPSLLFTSAGMVQFKDWFLGKRKGYKRATSCQKCFRTSDIDKIGTTNRHLTFFEMLGNFSFGDYFKKEAIAWGWQFLTQEVNLSIDKLYVTIYTKDEEAYNLWNQIIPSERIYRLGEDTNFWTMGPTGPCGPCSEIIYDLGREFGCSRPECQPGCDCDRWLEIWNLVFTEFNRDESGTLTSLPAKNIDTGMGLERLTSVVQQVSSNFDTDIFVPLTDYIKKNSSPSGPDNTGEITKLLRLLADHSRGITFLIADGVLPTNEGRGYVLRRLIRRAIRSGKRMGLNKLFVYQLSGKVVEIMSPVYPDLTVRREYIANVVKMEEEKFAQTLDTGLTMLNEIIERIQNKKLPPVLPGAEVYKLYDTFGFPPDLTEEIVRENKMAVNWDEFKEIQNKNREISRLSWTGSAGNEDTNNLSLLLTELQKKVGDTIFKGYETTELKTVVLAIIKNQQSVLSAEVNDKIEFVLSETPFYGESGGQVGDTGWLRKESVEVEVVNTTKPLKGIILHEGIIKKGNLQVNDKITALVDATRRHHIQRNHTATHLLHYALRKVLGEHVVQSGSLVTPEKLRFDFAHSRAVDNKEIDLIEREVTRLVLNNLPVLAREMSITESRQLGAIALFTEKYGDRVRVVNILADKNFNPDQPLNKEKTVSIELCAGVHCHHTGDIGTFKILSETSIGAGLRRIEAVTGWYAYEWTKQQALQQNKIAELLKTTPDKIFDRINRIIVEQKEREKEFNRLKEQMLTGKENSELPFQPESINGINVIIHQLPDGTDRKTIGTFIDKLKRQLQSGLVAVGTVTENKPLILITLTDDLVQTGWDAGYICRTIAPLLYGNGGGKPNFAQAGGKDLSKLSLALTEIKNIIHQHK